MGEYRNNLSLQRTLNLVDPHAKLKEHISPEYNSCTEKDRELIEEALQYTKPLDIAWHVDTLPQINAVEGKNRLYKTALKRPLTSLMVSRTRHSAGKRKLGK